MLPKEQLSEIDHDLRPDNCVLDVSGKDKNDIENLNDEIIEDESSNEEVQDRPMLKPISSTNVVEQDTSKNSESVQNACKEKLSQDLSKNKFRRKKQLMIVDSDSEEDVELSSPNENLQSDTESDTNFNTNKRKPKRLAVIESDSEVENEAEITPFNKSFSEDSKKKPEDNFTTNSKGQLVPENSNDSASVQKSRLSALCDSDSDEDYKQYDKKDNLEEKIEIQACRKKKPKKSQDKKPKKMTVKDAAKLRMEIKSESQRMVRLKNISLPYHISKSYTLQEFLTKRTRLSSIMPNTSGIRPAVAIKMPPEQLAVFSKKLQERAKELEHFYRSESESENDDREEDYIPPEELGTSHCEEVDNPSANLDPKHLLISDINENNGSAANTQITNKPEVQQEQDISRTESEENNLMTKQTNEMSDVQNKRSSANQRENIADSLSNNQTLSNLVSVENIEGKEILCKKPSQELVVLSATKQDVTSSDNSKAAEDNNCSNTVTTSKENEPYSMDYDFNLDDLEENSERLVHEKEINKVIPEKQKSIFEYTDLDREIENFNTNNDCKEINKEASPAVKNLSKMELIKERLANITPRLSGCPDDVIDLETGVTKPNEISKLIERFSKHTSKKEIHKHKVKLSIVSVESGEIHKETVAINVEDDTPPIEEKPGAKLQKLRLELQTQMAKKRLELWQQRATETKNEIDPFEGEKDQCGAEDDILDDEEEETELTESSEEEEDDEDDKAEDEDTEKEPVKSAFIDEEAEETDEENEEIVDNNEDDNLEDTEEEQIEEELIEEKGTLNVAAEQPGKRVLRRIAKGFTEDSDDEDLDSTSQTVTSLKQTDSLSGINQDDDDFIPPHQPQTSHSPIEKVTQTQNKPEFEFLTPISYITGIQNLTNSAAKVRDSPIALLQPANEPSPLKENNWQSSLQKKLFTDMEITDSQLEEICSDKFPETQTSNQEDSVNEEMLANMCSGKFPSTLDARADEVQSTETPRENITSSLDSQSNILQSEEPPSTQDLLNMCSGEFTGMTENGFSEKPNAKKSADVYQFSAHKEIKSLDEDQGLIISQLIDEEEMENFKRKFDSPLLSHTQKRIVEEFEEVVGSGRVIDSDDDDEILEVKKKKNQRKLVFSDDEYSNDEEKDEEVIDLHDNIDEDDDVSNVDEEDAVSNVDNVDYDSEENEIEITEENYGSKRPKASEFFDNEAELSESDWGSADEDEKDLDTMEFEQGDNEKFDEKKIKTDLGKIYMRELLDEDARDIRMLQELLLEDGEMHGEGRERQFRWRNIDSMDEPEERREVDDVFIEEEESEEQWRKKRYEREMFLKEKLSKSQTVEDDSLLGESQLLKIGHKVMQRSQVLSQGNTPTEKPKTDPESPILKQPFSLLTKRGSFLKRSDQVLQRLAEYNKSTTVIFGAAKNSKNFLFQAASEETSISVVQDKKRKATDGTPNAIKKLRLSSNLSPAVSGKKLDKPKSAKAKLFGNW